MKKLEILSIFIIGFIICLSIALFIYQGLSLRASYASTTITPIVTSLPKTSLENSSSPQKEEVDSSENMPFLIPLEPPMEPQKPSYYIRVNVAANTITVYGQDKDKEYTVPIKAFVCSTGTATPHSGVYATPQKFLWIDLLGNVYGQYSTQIVGHILFHSVPYRRKYDKASLIYSYYDRLGTSASAGCVRLTVEDAKWIYDNCELGTNVEFYDDKNNPGPLGKPTAQKISGNAALRNWDPTDPDENNPWKN